MSTRLALPSRRQSTTHKLNVHGCTIYVTVGFYDKDCKIPGELFITVDKAGEQVRTLADCLARMTSMALQYGAPLDKCMTQWLGVKGQLNGPVSGDEEYVRFSESAVDCIAKHILTRYCAGYEDLKPKTPPREA